MIVVNPNICKKQALVSALGSLLLQMQHHVVKWVSLVLSREAELRLERHSREVRWHFWCLFASAPTRNLGKEVVCLYGRWSEAPTSIASRRRQVRQGESQEWNRNLSEWLVDRPKLRDLSVRQNIGEEWNEFTSMCHPQCNRYHHFITFVFLMDHPINETFDF